MNDDLISRQAAIDALEREKSLVERPITETRWFDLGLKKAQEILSELPSTQPDRKKGEWLWIDGVRCSNCNHKLQTTGFPSICPNCGAQMDERREE